MADKIPAVPSLSNLSRPLLTSKENVCLYLIQFLFANPGETVSHHEGEMISFRKLVANHGHIDPADLAQQISNMLTTSISHYFPNAGIQAHCTIDEENGYDNGVYQGNYGVAIAIRDADGNAIIPRRQFKVAKDGSSFTSIFDNEV